MANKSNSNGDLVPRGKRPELVKTQEFNIHDYLGEKQLEAAHKVIDLGIKALDEVDRRFRFAATLDEPIPTRELLDAMSTLEKVQKMCGAAPPETSIQVKGNPSDFNIKYTALDEQIRQTRSLTNTIDLPKLDDKDKEEEKVEEDFE